MMRNPYAISFGRIPTQYIDRTLIIDSVLEALDSDLVEEQAFKLTGIRGTGKTVTLTAIERTVREQEDWIVVGLSSNSDILVDLIANLYSSVPLITAFIDSELNLSKFGIGVNISQKSPVASLDYALKRILHEVKKKGMKVLVTIDEARRTESIIDFVQEFQILIREDLPIYTIVAGLYEDIESLENTDGLTFFLRATKYEMTPLNLTIIREDYKKTLGVSHEVAEEMASITKGYPFAYQALGKYMWDEKSKEITETVLIKFDEALSEKVYKKIWSELAVRDRYFMEFISKKDKMSVAELLEMTGKKHNEWSEPRKRLSEKGIINTQIRGEISLCLPRFNQFVEAQI